MGSDTFHCTKPHPAALNTSRDGISPSFSVLSSFCFLCFIYESSCVWILFANFVPFPSTRKNMVGLGGGWWPSVRLRSGWTPREHDPVRRNAVWIILNKQVSYRNCSCPNTSLELSVLCRTVAACWRSMCEAAYFAKKLCIYSGLERVGCPSLAAACPLTCRALCSVACVALLHGLVVQCHELCSSAVSRHWELRWCGEGKKAKQQAFFSSVRSLLGMTSGEREGWSGEEWKLSKPMYWSHFEP